MFVNDNDDKKIETILTYHLLLIHEFYDNYILRTLINNKKHIYKNHPLDSLYYTIT